MTQVASYKGKTQSRGNATAKLVQKGQKKKKSGFGDMLPKLLENNLFDQAITELRKWADILNFEHAMDNIVYWNAHAALRTAFKVLFKWESVQSSNFPEFGPALLVANHQSVLDPFLIGTAIPREIRWMSKIQNFEMPVFKSILSFFGTFAVNREEKPTAVLDKAINILEKGECVGMFPGGTRSSTDQINPEFKTGAIRIALQAKVPYVPCAIIGSHYVLPKNAVKLKLHPIEIRVGEPVFLDKYYNKEYTRDDVVSLTEDMWVKVKDLMDAKRPSGKKYLIMPNSEKWNEIQRGEMLDLSLS